MIGPAAGIAIRFGVGKGFTGYPFMTFFPPILIAALAGGRKPGALAAVICGLLADYYLI